MMYKASSLICAEFDKAKIRYRVIVSGKDQEEVWVPFGVTFGPLVNVKFISRDDDSDVAVRVHGLINEIPENMTAKALEACNKLNNKVRYLKFCINDEGDISVEYDFPIKTSDEMIGKVAVENAVRFMRILDEEYLELAQMLYTRASPEKADEAENSDEDEDEGRSEALLRILEEIRRGKMAAEENDEEDDLPAFEAFAVGEEEEAKDNDSV